MTISEARLSTLSAAFKHRFGSNPQIFARAPGRVNLLGEHVDYNNGPVLPAAIDLNVWIAAAPTIDSTIHLSALDLDQSTAILLDQLDQKITTSGDRLPSWAGYPAGVAWSLLRAGFRIPGLQAVYTSDLPIGAGLSSSAAIEVGFAIVFEALGGWTCERLKLAQLCQVAENEYVGVTSGLMDQFTSACGVGGHALYFDTRSLACEAVRIPLGAAVVIADSGTRRSLSDSTYNQRRTSCEEAVQILDTFSSRFHSLRDVSPVEFAAYAPYLPETPRRRAEHVVKEIARVQSGLAALQRSDLQAFGALMLAGHTSLRDLYEVSTPELDTLVRLARGLPGCYGARLTGAGFGGCTVNLVASDRSDEFIESLGRAYQREAGRIPSLFRCHAEQGAAVI